ncbi:hypothetical protein [Pleomorphomonas oryzae]|uniref:hypothetical protein n=1 Tax=Pleomorphomonas oryzae TaxID=261934 RepID=UPI0005633D3C|nr:hypothetical protein [Pleomorphomonas oryzae]
MTTISPTIADLLDRIEEHCAKRGIAETTFGRHVVNDGKFVGRLRSGASLTVRILEKVEKELENRSFPYKKH